MRLSEACLPGGPAEQKLHRSPASLVLDNSGHSAMGSPLHLSPAPSAEAENKAEQGAVSWALHGWLGDCRQPWADRSFQGQCDSGRQGSTCVPTRISSLPEQTGPSQGEGSLPEPQLCGPNSHPCLAHPLVHLYTHRHLYIPPTCLHIHTGVHAQETPCHHRYTDVHTRHSATQPKL